MTQLTEFLLENTVLVTVIVGLLVSLVVVILQVTRTAVPAKVTEDWLNKPNKSPVILIIGAPDSGKTSFFQYLVHLSRQGLETSELVPFSDLNILSTKSFKPNIHTIKLPFHSSYKTEHVLIDVPGEDKIYSAKIKEICGGFRNIKGAVFMLDACVNNNKLHSIAEKLFQFLLLSEKRPNGIDVLLAVNKTEQFGARPVAKFRDLLEKEINEVKNLGLKSLKKSDETEDEILEGFGRGEFKFTQLEGNFDVVGGSVKKSKVEDWLSWIDGRVVN